jgi:hypothetical protein
MSIPHKMMFVTLRLQPRHIASLETDPARTFQPEPDHKIQDVS